MSKHFWEAFGADMASYAESFMEKGNRQRQTGSKAATATKASPLDDVRSKMRKFKEERSAKPERQYGYYDRGRRKEVYMDAETAKKEAPKSAAPTCPYCDHKAVIKTAKEYKGMDQDMCYWVCPHCEDASVTTIKGTYRPSGVLADARLRRLRSLVHQQVAFKKTEFNENRVEIQRWIASLLKIDTEEAKIGVMTEEQLIRLVEKANEEVYRVNYAPIFEREDKK